MSEQIVSSVIASVSTLVGIIAGLFVGHFLERRRKKEELLFQAKKDIYSKILVGMSSSFFWDDIGNLSEGISDPHFRAKMKLHAGELLSQGRLLAKDTLSNMLRDFFSLEQEIWAAVDNNVDTNILTNRRARLAMEIEVLMKKEINL